MEKQKIATVIFESISDGVFTVDHNCHITSFNKAAENISGFDRNEAIGQYCFDIFHSDICQSRCALRNTLANGMPIYNTRVTIITRNGKKVPVSVSTTILQDEKGKSLGAVEFIRDLSTIENLQQELCKVKKIGQLVSYNGEMQKIFNIVPQIANAECSVLIEGPSGAGKEIIAEAIHHFSPRKDSPYIKINCAALPENLLESELFGYVKGAFTDAKRDKPGHFLMAQGGTLLLDEIGEMPITLQSKLLRVLNNGEFQPLGSTRPLHTDARILSATNCDLEKKIKEGTFREDLYYRINVINIKIPPLNQRIEDLPILIDCFVKRLRKKCAKAILGVSDKALQCLRSYDFPGNVRELENAIEHAFVLCCCEVIEPEHLPPKILNNNNNSSKLPPKTEAVVIKETLDRHGWNRKMTASELGIDRSTLWRKVKKYGITQS